jgi:PBP1b-binding outer membrane lipoprotein LpoB
MNGVRLKGVLTLAALTIIVGGCATPEHRMNVAASQDEARRSDFERCRSAGRTDCDAILNAPVDSNTARGDSVREQERRDAYDRCVARRGSDCDDLLQR